MVKELVTEQERLVRALQERQEESQSVARLGSTLVNRVGSLKAQLEVKCIPCTLSDYSILIDCILMINFSFPACSKGCL